MIDYLFPIFGFGVAITGIVVKGLLTAHDMATSQGTSRDRIETDLPNDNPRAAFSEL